MPRKSPLVSAILVIAIIVMTGCGTTGFVPAPPPVDSDNVMNIQQLKVGDGQLMSITAPTLDVDYRQNGEGAGQTATETITRNDGRKGTMLSVVWGSWEKAELTLVNYYDPDGGLVSGLVDLRFEELSLFQLTPKNIDATLNRSSVTLLYEQRDGVMRLTQVQYAEKWGPGKKELAFGGYAVWTTDLDKIITPAYHTWGFWESAGTPADQVREVLKAAMVAANEDGLEPDFQAVDLDSGREFLGRQTGLTVLKDGNPWGAVSTTYGNALGRQPNTGLIGKGALKLVEWELGEESYYLLILSPKASPVGSALYIFTTKKSVVDEMYGFSDTPQQLYARLRAGVDGVFLAVYGIGDIGAVTDTAGEDTVYVGDSGGVQLRTLGPTNYDDTMLAVNLLALLGPGQYQNGFYYAYEPGSGSGLSYYLASLALTQAPPETVFYQFGQDVGLLDRVLIPNLDLPPFE